MNTETWARTAFLVHHRCLKEVIFQQKRNKGWLSHHKCIWSSQWCCWEGSCRWQEHCSMLLPISHSKSGRRPHKDGCLPQDFAGSNTSMRLAASPWIIWFGSKECSNMCITAAGIQYAMRNCNWPAKRSEWLCFHNPICREEFPSSTIRVLSNVISQHMPPG